MEVPSWLFWLLVILVIFLFIEALHIVDIIPNVGIGWPN